MAFGRKRHCISDSLTDGQRASTLPVEHFLFALERETRVDCRQPAGFLPTTLDPGRMIGFAASGLTKSMFASP